MIMAIMGLLIGLAFYGILCGYIGHHRRAQLRRSSLGIYATVIADSINPSDIRLITFELRYHRFIHAELMTHRDFSRNAASSRAIPIWKMIRAVINDPAVPLNWGTNKAGMQAGAELTGIMRTIAIGIWLEARWPAIAIAWTLDKVGVHKQIVNRVLEPWTWITVVCSSTKWCNFFALRAHPMAQPEFQVLAYKVLHEYIISAPKVIGYGGWHLPYTNDQDAEEAGPDSIPKISAARSARVSYLNQNGVRDLADDIGMFKRLSDGDPMHASALEHPAQAVHPFHSLSGHSDGPWEDETPSNFHPSWRQLRKDHPRENVHTIDLLAVMKTKPDWIKNLNQ